ncbi:MAG: type II toxin-antitoxin system RelE/ParE family toxin [Bacteroidota bacterium]
MSYKISAKAKVDLIDIWEFTNKRWSQEQADRYYQIIIDTITEAAKTPDIGKSYDNLRSGYRGVVAKAHIIFYKIKHQHQIEIIRILHQRMDFQNRLK